MYRLTARAWRLLFLLAIVVGLLLGSVVLSPGRDLCDWHGAGMAHCRR